MDPILERFNRLIKSMFVDPEDIGIGYEDFPETSENDYAEAWEELNDYLSSGATDSKRTASYERKPDPIVSPPEILRHDYHNLEVPFDANFTEVKKSYKKLIIKHHPDKNSHTDELMQRATEKTKTLNISYQRIKAWELAKKG